MTNWALARLQALGHNGDYYYSDNSAIIIIIISIVTKALELKRAKSCVVIGTVAVTVIMTQSL